MAAAKSSTNTLMMGALGLGAFYLWKKSEDAKAAAAPIPITPTPPAPLLAPVINITLPPLTATPTTPAATTTPTTPLQPVVNLNPTAPLQPVVVHTDYGDVIPLQPATATPTTPSTPMAACLARNGTWTQTQCNQRLVEVPLRHRYIQNSILDGRQVQAKLPAGHPDIAAIQGRLDTLASKDAALQAEWHSYNGGLSIPEINLADAGVRAAYVAFLKSQSPPWSDAILGV